MLQIARKTVGLSRQGITDMRGRKPGAKNPKPAPAPAAPAQACALCVSSAWPHTPVCFSRPPLDRHRWVPLAPLGWPCCRLCVGVGQLRHQGLFKQHPPLQAGRRDHGRTQPAGNRAAQPAAAHKGACRDGAQADPAVRPVPGPRWRSSSHPVPPHAQRAALRLPACGWALLCCSFPATMEPPASASAAGMGA